MGSRTDRWPVGEAMFFAVTSGVEGTGRVVLRGAEPVVERNTAHAELDHVVCIPVHPGSGGIHSGTAASVAEHCAELLPVGGEPVRYEPRGNRQVLLRIVPATEGSVLVRGSDLTYEHGWRSGTQRTGDGFLVGVRQE